MCNGIGRHAVWILGSASTLCAHSRLWRNLVDNARQVNCFFNATRVEWMNDLINLFRKRNKPVLQQRDGDERTSKFWEHQLPVSPRKSGWESEEPPMVQTFTTLFCTILSYNTQAVSLLICYYSGPFITPVILVGWFFADRGP